MANGDNEKLVFTRKDSERLVRIENKLDDVIDIKNLVKRNSTWITVFKWLYGGSGIIAAITMYYQLFIK